jgi:hypothetical protein
MNTVVGKFKGTFVAGDVFNSAQTVCGLYDEFAVQPIGASSANVYVGAKTILLPVMHYLVFEAVAAYTPASAEVFTFRLNTRPAD